jgi:hypothetical protein
VRELTVDQGLGSAIARHAISQPESSVDTVARNLIGLHHTNPASAHQSLRARMRRFSRSQLDELMWGTWQLARFRAMRLTMFVFPHDVLEVAAAATRHLAEPLAARWLRDAGLTQREFDRVAAEVAAALADGPLTTRQLRTMLELPPPFELPGVVSRLCDLGRVVGGAPAGSWRSSVRRYHRWEDVLPSVDLRRWEEGAAIREMIVRYLRSYGPVTIDDVAWWTGIAKGRCRQALDALGSVVEEVTVDGWPGPLYRASDSPMPAAPAETVRALPLLDPYVQGYRHRIRFLDPDRHGFVYDRGGNAAATLVHRGRIIGVWQYAQEPAESVRYHVFTPVPAAVRAAGEAELADAGLLYFDHPVDVVKVATMTALHAEGGRSAAHPLDGIPHRGG